MAKTPKAPGKGTPPPIKLNKVNSNLDKGKTVDLNFKIDASFKKQFKQAALDRDLTLKKFLILLFDEYKSK
jgi:hypothetical protein